ncbi:hypothetical protein Pan97_12190 [Bremerella volcania]|uniref:Uncharacterized protein n=1 Tax=Bremerella volcania TaxID=2527984 RepID=A0A518C4V7_9BACT|nr:hypothetical protein [Bremerella volcania]QDU74214.1 hypothetical protein Pan97_12190 [Bremerella volcania]
MEVFCSPGMSIQEVANRASEPLKLDPNRPKQSGAITGPVNVHYLLTEGVVRFDNAGLLTLSFEQRILLFVRVNPHLYALTREDLSKVQNETLELLKAHGGFIRPSQKAEFEELIETLAKSKTPRKSPPWSFGGLIQEDTFAMTIYKQQDRDRYTFQLMFDRPSVTKSLS